MTMKSSKSSLKTTKKVRSSTKTKKSKVKGSSAKRTGFATSKTSNIVRIPSSPPIDDALHRKYKARDLDQLDQNIVSSQTAKQSRDFIRVSSAIKLISLLASDRNRLESQFNRQHFGPSSFCFTGVITKSFVIT